MVDLAAQVFDVHIDDVGQAFKTEIPDVLQNHIAGDCAAGVAHEIFQDRILALREVDHFAGTRHHMPYAVEFQVLNSNFVQRLLWTTQQSVHTSQ